MIVLIYLIVLFTVWFSIHHKVLQCFLCGEQNINMHWVYGWWVSSVLTLSGIWESTFAQEEIAQHIYKLNWIVCFWCRGLTGCLLENPRACFGQDCCCGKSFQVMKLLSSKHIREFWKAERYRHIQECVNTVCVFCLCNTLLVLNCHLLPVLTPITLSLTLSHNNQRYATV